MISQVFKLTSGATHGGAPVPAPDDVICVKETFTGTGDGSSWANAMGGSSLQTAINDASVSGKKVLIYQGNYSGNYDVKTGVRIIGGFTSEHYDYDNENGLLDRTASAFTSPNGIEDYGARSYHSVFYNIAQDGGTTSTLEYLKLTGGGGQRVSSTVLYSLIAGVVTSATDTSLPSTTGWLALKFCDICDLNIAGPSAYIYWFNYVILTNCKIYHNNVSSAYRMQIADLLTIENLEVYSNTFTVNSESYLFSGLQFANSKFYGNHLIGNGFLFFIANCALDNTLVYGNKISGTRGCLLAYAGSTRTIVNSTIYNNADVKTGSTWYGFCRVSNKQDVIVNTIFAKNIKTSAYGTIIWGDGSVSIRNVLCFDNSYNPAYSSCYGNLLTAYNCMENNAVTPFTNVVNATIIGNDLFEHPSTFTGVPNNGTDDIVGYDYATDIGDSVNGSTNTQWDILHKANWRLKSNTTNDGLSITMGTVSTYAPLDADGLTRGVLSGGVHGTATAVGPYVAPSEKE